MMGRRPSSGRLLRDITEIEDDDDDDTNTSPIHSLPVPGSPSASTLPPVHQRRRSRSMFLHTWTKEHDKLLYLISLYSQPAGGRSQKEVWIRKVPLFVFMYELIVGKILDYDYAPSSEVVDTKRIFLNVTQEGKDDLDDLIESKFVKGLRLITKEHKSVTAYQISDKGMEVLDNAPQKIKQPIDDLLRIGEGETSGLLQVKWNSELEKFFMVDEANDFSRESTITEIEDVSYVSSPYLPLALTNSQFTNHFSRAREASQGLSNIRDDLDEVITLDDVHILCGEFIPCGANNMVALNDKLGSTERCQGGYFTATSMDISETGETTCSVPTGLTVVKLLDYDITRHINFEAEVYFPEGEGVIQIENFGLHFHVSGSVLYGLKIESIMDRIKKNVSLDHLSRLLADVHKDTCKIVDSVISSYQKNLLDIVFLDHAENRDKLNIILCESIHPALRAQDYLDKDAKENELKQVLGETQFAKDVGLHQVLIVGQKGILLAGQNTRRHEQVLLSYAGLVARGLFINNYFSRLFIVSDTLVTIRNMIHSYEKDPNSIGRIREMLSDSSKTVVLLEEILQYLTESIALMEFSEKDSFKDESSLQLWEVLDIGRLQNDLSFRVLDLNKLVKGLEDELKALREMTDVISEKQSFRIQEALQGNTKRMEDVFRSNERSSFSLQLMQVMLAGSLAFDILDRITGEWSVVGEDGQWWGNGIFGPILDVPFLWFAISLLFWALIGYILVKLMYFVANSKSSLSLRVKVNEPMDVECLETYLSNAVIIEEEFEVDSNVDQKKVVWLDFRKELWFGSKPKIEMSFDKRHGFLLSVFLTVDVLRGSAPSLNDLKNSLFHDLWLNGVLKNEDYSFGAPATTANENRKKSYVKI